MQSHHGAPEAPGVPANYLAVLTVGSGLYLGWQTIGISPTLFPQPAPGTYDLVSRWSYRNTLIVVTLLVLYTLALRRSPAPRPLAHRRLFAAVVGTCVCLGSFLTMAGGWFGQEQPIEGALAAGQALMAVKAGFIVLWGSLLCRVGLRNAFMCVAGTYVVGFCICLLVANLKPAAAITLRCILPALSTWAYFIISADPLQLPIRPTTEEGRLPERRLAGIWGRLFAGIGVFGAIIVFSNHLSEAKAYESTELYTLIAGLAVSLILLAVAALTSAKKRLNFIFLYRLITPLIIGSLMLTLILEPGDQQYEALAIGGSWALFRIFSWTLWCYIAVDAMLVGGQAFAIGQASLMLASTVAESICNLVPPADIPVTVSVSGIVLLTVLNSTLVMNEGSLLSIIKGRREALEPAGDQPTSEQASTTDPVLNTSAAQLCVERAARLHDLSEREQEITLLVLLGKDNAQISDEISIAGSTLRTHLRNIYGKTDVHSRGELVDLLRSMTD